jgi:rubrerythrin
MMNAIATILVLAVAGALVAAMIYILKLSSDDSGKTSELKQFVEALFGGSRQEAAGEDDSAAALKRLAEHKDAFSEPCPACGETVTHQDADCPACGLRLV